MSDELTEKQRAFIHHYMTNGFNGTQAARAAGYEGDENVWAVTAYDNLRNPKIRAVIDAYFAELHMNREEVLGRLADMARGSLEYFLNEDGTFDLTTAEAIKHRHLIKKSEIEIRHGTNQQTGQDWEEIKTKIEIHDPKDALVQIGKHLKLFSDVTQVRTWEDEVADLLRDGKITIEQIESELGSELAARIAIRTGIRRGQDSENQSGDRTENSAGDSV